MKLPNLSIGVSASLRLSLHLSPYPRRCSRAELSFFAHFPPIIPPHEVVRSSVEGMPDSSLKQMLASQLGEMQQSLQQQSARQQVLEDLVRQRLVQSKQTNWWQLFRETVTQAWATLKKRSLLDSAAQMKSLFHAQVPPGGRVYQADNIRGSCVVG